MSKKKKDQTEQVNLPEELSSFLKLLDQVQKDYAWFQEEEVRIEQLTQDYLHKLELTDPKYHDRAKIATNLRQCRIDRRNAKDAIALMEPLVSFLGTEKGKMVVSQLQQVLGTTRKIAKNASLRSYYPRVLTNEEFNGEKERVKV